MTQELVTALILGLVGGLIPGPVLASICTEILQSGFYKSLRIVLFAVFGETVVAIVSLLALTSFGLPQSFFYALSFIGAGILIWIAVALWKIRSLDTGEKVNFTFGKITALIFANGTLWTFWITVCIPKAIVLGQHVAHGEYMFLVAVQVGWLVATVGIAIAFALFQGALSDPRAIPIMFKGFAVVFVYFAVSMIYTSAVFFLG